MGYACKFEIKYMLCISYVIVDIHLYNHISYHINNMYCILYRHWIDTSPHTYSHAQMHRAMPRWWFRTCFLCIPLFRNLQHVKLVVVSLTMSFSARIVLVCVELYMYGIMYIIGIIFYYSCKLFIYYRQILFWFKLSSCIMIPVISTSPWPD